MAAWKVHIAEREKKNKSGKGNIRDLCSLGFRCIRPEIHRRGVPSIVKCGPARQWRAAFAEELSDGSKWFFLVWVVVFFCFCFWISSFTPVHFPWLFLQKFFGSRSSRTHEQEAANTSRLPNLYKTVGEFLWANGTPESGDLLLCSFCCNK